MINNYMNNNIYILFILFALLISSFLNVVIYRVPRHESIVFPPSHCTKCRHRLKAWELIPVVSYLFLKGRCSHCKSKISIRYPLVEMLTAFLFLLVFIKFGISLDTLFFMILTGILICVSFIDYDTMLIPNGLILFGLISGIIYRMIYHSDIVEYLIGIAVGSGLLLLIVALTGAMGMGDVKLMAVIALFIDWKLILLTLFLSFIIGAIVSTILMSLKIKSRKDYVPFGPFISTAAYISLLYGYRLIGLYISIIIR